MGREKLLRFTDEKEKAKRKAVKPDSDIGKCIVEKKLSQRTEKNSTELAFHIFSTLQLINENVAVWASFLVAVKIYFFKFYNFHVNSAKSYLCWDVPIENRSRKATFLFSHCHNAL